VLHASGTTPRRAKTKPIFAALEARRMSMASVSVAPKPTAGPLMAAITGFLRSKMRSATRPPPSRWSSASVRARSNVAPPAPRSAPAQKARPAPVTMTTRTPSSPSARSSAAMRVSSISLFTAFRRSGRFSVSVQTPSATS
jgi:hypothetical protein